jgi:hypothetical protein
MVTGRMALAGCATLFTLGCASPMAERPPSAEPERTYVGQRDERPLTTLATVKAAPATACPVGPDEANGARLSQLSLFSRTLFYLRELYPADITPRSRQLLLAALSAIPPADREVAVEADPEVPPRWVNVSVKGQRCTLNLERVDAPSSLRSSLQQAVRFLGSRVMLPADEAEARFTRIEIAATNGMLAALDRHSLLMDADAYAKVRASSTGPSASAVGSPEGQDARRAAFAAPEAGEVAYLSLGAFQRGAGAEVQRSSIGSGGPPPKGVVLDLRDNKGGLVEEAAGVADVFIQRGVLGWIVGKRERTALEAHDGEQDFTGAVVVLVNHETASGAELVASAIQNLGRGVILGEVTAGAGAVRAFFDLSRHARQPDAPSPAGGPDRDVVKDIPEGGEAAAPGDGAQPSGGEREEVLGLLLRTGSLRTANDHEIEGSGVRPDLQFAGPVGPSSASRDECLVRFARALISQAPDARRSTLLATAKALASRQDCGQAR